MSHEGMPDHSRQGPLIGHIAPGPFGSLQWAGH